MHKLQIVRLEVLPAYRTYATTRDCDLDDLWLKPNITVPQPTKPLTHN